MKNIQVIDGAENSVYDIFAATDKEFALIFPTNQDIAFIDEVMTRGPEKELDEAFTRIWQRRVPKREAMGIHGLLFYEHENKKQSAWFHYVFNCGCSKIRTMLPAFSFHSIVARVYPERSRRIAFLYACLPAGRFDNCIELFSSCGISWHSLNRK